MAKLLGLSGLGLAGALVASACSFGGGEIKGKEVCLALLTGDLEVETDLQEDGNSIDTYCDCYDARLASLSESDRESVLKVSTVIADLRTEQELEVDGAASLIEDDTSSDASGPTYGVTAAEFRTAGEFVDGVRRDMRDNDGQCPA